MTKQDKKAEKTSWVVDEVKKYGMHDPYDENLYMNLISQVLKIVGKKKLKILDLGCGSSAYGLRFARLGHEVVGVDISKEIVASATKRAKLEKVNATFKVMDIEKLDFSKNSFDLCFFGGVLHHFPDIRKVMKEAIRVLKKNGHIVCVEPNKQNPHVRLSMQPKSPFRYKHLTINERSISYVEVLEALKKNVVKYDVFYMLLTLTKSGRHATNSFIDKPLVYNLGGFAWKYVKGGVLRRILAIIAYNLVHLYQRFSGSKRYGNFFILIAKMK